MSGLAGLNKSPSGLAVGTFTLPWSSEVVHTDGRAYAVPSALNPKEAA